jgi:hypothetical protein
MRVVATIEDPVVIRKILTHLGLPIEARRPQDRQSTHACTASTTATATRVTSHVSPVPHSHVPLTHDDPAQHWELSEHVSPAALQQMPLLQDVGMSPTRQQSASWLHAPPPPLQQPQAFPLTLNDGMPVGHVPPHAGTEEMRHVLSGKTQLQKFPPLA